MKETNILDTNGKHQEDISKDSAMETLLSDLLVNESELVPEFDMEYGYRYIRAEKLLNLDPDETKAFLEKMVEIGLLFKEHYDRTLRCPKCNSPNISINYICPFDQTSNITKDALIEHLACGYIDALSKFRQDGELVCPQCKATMTTESYRVSGSWNQCQECGRRLEVLSVVHRCRKCNTKFTYEDSQIDDVYTYSLIRLDQADMGRDLSYIPYLRDILEKTGFKVQKSPVIEGSSGIEYEFDLVSINQKGREVTVDINFMDEPITREILMEKYGKYMDTHKESYLLIAPLLQDELEKLAESIDMNIIQAETPSKVLQLFAIKLGLEKGEKPQGKRGFSFNLLTKIFGKRPSI